MYWNYRLHVSALSLGHRQVSRGVPEETIQYIVNNEIGQAQAWPGMAWHGSKTSSFLLIQTCTTRLRSINIVTVGELNLSFQATWQYPTR